MNSPLVQSPAYLPRKIPTSAFSLRWSPPRRARHFAQLHTWLTGENLLNRSNSSAGQNRSKTKSTTNFNLCLNAITATNFSGIIATSSGRTSRARCAGRWSVTPAALAVRDERNGVLADVFKWRWQTLLGLSFYLLQSQNSLPNGPPNEIRSAQSPGNWG